MDIQISSNFERLLFEAYGRDASKVRAAMIKLDKALVRDGSDKKATVLRSVIAMARELEMKVVAEGIESNEDAIELAKMGCNYGQSYLFGPPIASESVLRLLRERFPLTKRA